MNNNRSRVTFENFLHGSFAKDYVVQVAPYYELIGLAVEKLKNADNVLIGVGAGMSTAAGAEYGGEFFKEKFAEFIEIYGDNNPYMQNMYSAGFYPFPDEESRWGFWSRLALTAGADLDVTPLHKTLLEALKNKNIFILSTNADNQFTKAGCPAEKIFATQGSYDLIQCKRGCHQKTYNAVSMFRQMDQARRNGKVPEYMVPRCPVCGGPMTMNLRVDGHFVQDGSWYQAERRFGEFVSDCLGGSTVLLELGVGFNTPTIIRLPFERLAKEHKNLSLIRLNLNEAIIPESLGDRAVGINADMAKSITDIAVGLKE